MSLEESFLDKKTGNVELTSGRLVLIEMRFKSKQTINGVVEAGLRGLA